MNKYQTTFDEAKKIFEPYEFKDEAFGDLHSFVDTIKFIQNMVSEDRPKISDLERDEEGKVIIDITNMPILEDMDYFRQPAIRYIETGRYTDLFPNGNPNSEYRKFWDEEMRRCIDGYVRESDGMWITGYNYWYWNYNPIMLTKKAKRSKGKGRGVRANRVYEHPEPWDGDVMYFHYVEQAESNAQHGVVAKARGRGYSFKGGSMLNRNLYMIKKSVNYAFASIEEFLTNDGLLNKAWDTLSFINSNTPFLKHFSPDKIMHKRAAYYDMGSQSYKGYLSEVAGVIVNKPDKVRGKRCKLALWEEAGAFPDLDTAWNIFRKSVEDGNYVFGTAIAFGTGGSKNQKDLEALEKLFYSPRGYNIYEINNVFDVNVAGTTCGFFSPAYLNRKGCYDEDGNSDIIKALCEVIILRLTVIYGTSDTSALTQAKAEDPVTPVEAFLRVNTSVFPVADIKEYLTEIIPNQEGFVSSHYVGDLMHVGNNTVSWRLNANLMPLRTYPIQETDTSGAVEIFEMPKKGDDAKPPYGRYVMGLDPTDSDTGTSLFSAFVFDLWKDTIVAEFTGRRRTANENYEIALKMALYYNAKINYENNLKGLYAYFDNRNALHLLMETPAILKDQEMIRNIGYGNKAYGTPANKAVNNWARKLLADWMLQEHMIDNGEDTTKTIKLRSIRSLGLLREAASWNPDGNFDRVSAMGMVMIARAEMTKFTEQNRFGNKIEDPLDNDEFLNNNAGSFAKIII